MIRTIFPHLKLKSYIARSASRVRSLILKAEIWPRVLLVCFKFLMQFFTSSRRKFSGISPTKRDAIPFDAYFCPWFHKVGSRMYSKDDMKVRGVTSEQMPPSMKLSNRPIQWWHQPPDVAEHITELYVNVPNTKSKGEQEESRGQEFCASSTLIVIYEPKVHTQNHKNE